MFNLQDEIVQTVKYDLLELKIHNRNIMIDDSESLGFQKKIKEDYLIKLSDKFGSINSDLSQSKYDLSWKLLLNEIEINTLFEIISTHNLNSRLTKQSSYYLYGSAAIPSLPSKITLIDNKVKDFFSGNYEEYQIIFKNVDNLSLFKVDRNTDTNYYTIELEAETL